MALFLGGPWHGQHHPTNNAPRIAVPLIEDEAFDLLVANGSSDEPPPNHRIKTYEYERRRVAFGRDNHTVAVYVRYGDSERVVDWAVINFLEGRS